MTVGQRIADRIAIQGPIPVSEYVNACLYDPDGGFYMRAGDSGGRAGGRAGDYLTAPEVGPLFGAVLARALDCWWAELDNPEPFVVIDWGAGPGTLTRTVLAAKPICLSVGALRWVAVELSPAQRALHPPHPQVTSVASVHEALPEGAASGVVVANELLDNLPFDLVQRTGTGWEELRVANIAPPTNEDPEFTSDPEFAPEHAGLTRRVLSTSERLAPDAARVSSVPTDRVPMPTSDIRSSPGRRFRRFELFAVAPASELLEGLIGLADVAVGARVPVQRAARQWVSQARELLREGRVVALDYGAETAVLAQRALRHAAPSANQGARTAHTTSSTTLPAIDPSTGLSLNTATPADSDPSKNLGLNTADRPNVDLSEDLGWLRTHRGHDSSTGWLTTEPGYCDITTDVALDQVQADHTAEVCTQADFLHHHGIEELVAEGQAEWSRRAHIGDLAALHARSRANEAKALLDPNGMGNFKVLTWKVEPL